MRIELYELLMVPSFSGLWAFTSLMPVDASGKWGFDGKSMPKAERINFLQISAMIYSMKNPFVLFFHQKVITKN
jgi:hypothetical protein